MPTISKQIVLVDSQDNVLGYGDKLKCHHNPVPLHRSISVVIFNKDGTEMLIQKRSAHKHTWPLYWTNICCTDVRPRESYKLAATRRLKEEMGFPVPLKEAFVFIYKAVYDKKWGEHELDHVFVGKYGGGVKPDPKEVADYKWIGLKELKGDIKLNPDHYSPWFKTILKKLKV